MNFNPAIPIYLQIMDVIKKEIVTGKLPGGERLESVRALSERFGVNLNTMQRACAELERQGVIYTQRGIGSFVTEDGKRIAALKEAMSADMIQSFVSGMESIGFVKGEIVEIVRKVLEP